MTATSSLGRTLGIDLAAQAKETAACVIEWRSAPATVIALHVGLDDAAIDRLIHEHRPVKVGIDAPFGWPAAFVDTLAEYQSSGRWIGSDTRPLRLRRTDLAVTEQSGQQPLSVSSDRIAVTAMRCAALLTRLAGDEQVDRAGTGLCAEVYPAASLRQWGLLPRGYKGNKPEHVRARVALVTAFFEGSATWLLLTGEQKALVEATDHALDALLSAVTVGALVSGRTIAIEDGDLAAARQEGWIHLPLAQPLTRFDPAAEERGR